MRLLSFVLCFMFLSVSVWAQQEELDSLQQLLHKQADDTSKVNTLNELSYVYYQTVVYDSELYYAQQALNLSQKLNWKRGMAVSLKILAVPAMIWVITAMPYIITDVL